MCGNSIFFLKGSNKNVGDDFFLLLFFFLFCSQKDFFLGGGPGNDYVTWGSMRGLKKIAPNGTKPQTNIRKQKTTDKHKETEKAKQ